MPVHSGRGGGGGGFQNVHGQALPETRICRVTGARSVPRPGRADDGEGQDLGRRHATAPPPRPGPGAADSTFFLSGTPASRSYLSMYTYVFSII